MRTIGATERPAGFHITALLLTLLMVVPAYWIAQRRPTPPVELRAQDMLFNLRPKIERHPDILLVAVDKATTDKYGRLPLNRTVWASLINRVQRDGTGKGAKVVVVDQFFEKRHTRAEDETLWKAMSSPRNVIIPVAYPNPDRRVATRDDLQAMEELERSAGPSVTQAAEGAPVGFRKKPETDTHIWLAFDPPVFDFARNAKYMGTSTTSEAADLDGVIRRNVTGFIAPVDYAKAVVAGYKVQSNLAGTSVVVPSLPVVASWQVFGLTKDLMDWSFGDRVLYGGELNPPVIAPVDEEGRMIINYLGPTGSFPYVSARDVLEGKVKPETFDGKVVVIGVTNGEPGQSEEGKEAVQWFRVPTDDAMPRMEITANALNTLMTRQMVTHRGYHAAGYLAVFGLLFGLLVPLARPGLDFLLGLFLSAVYFIVAILMLRFAGQLMPLIPAAILAAGSYAFILILRAVFRSREVVVPVEDTVVVNRTRGFS
jgi:adenylate cyclase